MAISQVVKSWDLQGVLDNCADYIDQIVPEDTPFYNSISKVGARTNSFSWVQDDNDSLGVVNPKQEVVIDTQVTTGSEEDGTKSAQSTRLNYSQIFRKFVTVSKTAAANSAHGRKNETVYQLAKATTALKNQIEGTFLSGQIKQAATATTSAKTDGFTSQIPADCIFAGPITADVFDEAVQKLFLNGSTADTIFVNAAGAKALAHIASVGTKVGPYLQWQENGKDFWTITDANGKLYKIFTSRHLTVQNPTKQIAYIFNSDDWSCVEFRPLKIEQLDTRGSYDQYLISGELGLRHNGRHKAAIIHEA